MMKIQGKKMKKIRKINLCVKKNARHRGNKGGDSGQLES